MMQEDKSVGPEGSVGSTSAGQHSVSTHIGGQSITAILISFTQCLPLPFTFTSTCGEGDHISGHPALRPLHGPLHNSDRPQGWQNLLEAFANFRRRNQWISLKVS